jgi:hypothetical protein
MKVNVLKSILASIVFLLVVSSAVSAQTQVEPWNSELVYLKGDRVTWNTDLWEARWWTKGDEPGTQGEWGVWKLIPQEISLNVQKSNWIARVDKNGFGVVELEIAGTVYGADVVTVETHGDGLLGEHKLTVDAYGAFNEVVQIQFTHAPDDVPFTTSTIVRAKKNDIVVSKTLNSPTLVYLPGLDNARLQIGLVNAHGLWGPITEVAIDDVIYELPCNVVLPKGNHKLEAMVKWWVQWSWSDIHTFLPGNPPNPRYISLTGDTKIDIIVSN